MELHFLHEPHAGAWERLKPWRPEEELVSQEGSSHSSGTTAGDRTEPKQ